MLLLSLWTREGGGRNIQPDVFNTTYTVQDIKVGWMLDSGRRKLSPHSTPHLYLLLWCVSTLRISVSSGPLVHATQSTAQGAFSVSATEKDPYQYQVGFGNRFASEAMYVNSITFLSPCINESAVQELCLAHRITPRRSSMTCMQSR